MRKVLFALIAIGTTGAAGDEARKPAAPDAGADKTGAPVFFLRDRSKIAGMPKVEAIDVNTQYGALKVPRDQIVRIRFARRLAPELKEKIQSLIADLGNEDFDKREGAMKALREVGAPALESLRKAAKSSNEEVKNRSEMLLGELDTKAAEPKPGAEDALPQLPGTDDEIVTQKMTIRGVVPISEFVIDSRYGDLKVATADLTGIVFHSTGPTGTKVDVPAVNQPPGNWFDSKLDIEKDQKIKIEASGQITVRNYGISAGPEGTREWGGTSFQNFPMLALVGKIGKKGQAFLVGSNFNTKTKTAGRLYLAIVSFSPNAGGANGSYHVSVQASSGGK